MPPAPERYHYDHEFQARVLALMLRDPSCLRIFRDVLDARYFTLEEHRVVAREILKHHDNYHQAPAFAEVRAALADVGNRTGEDIDGYLGLVRRLETLDMGDPGFLLERIVRFGKRQALRLALSDIIDLLDRDDGYDDARKILDGALSVGANRDEGIDLHRGLANLEALVQDSSYSGHRVPLGITALDEALKGGVAGPQLIAVQAPPKTGKSTLLTNFGFASVVCGVPTLHISFELYEVDVLLMYLARMTGMTRDQVSQDFDTVRATWEATYGALPNETLKIKYFAPWTLTASGLRDYVSRLKQTTGFAPQRVVLDYADRMRVKGDNYYREFGTLYDELIATANDFGFHILTASQSNRLGYQADRGQANQAADSWLKVANADGWIPIGQTKEERAAHVFRLNVEFLRRGEDGFEVPCGVDYARCIVKQNGDPIRT